MEKILKFSAVLTLLLFGKVTASAQCFQIESILVDACGAQEGLNEMVRFKIGNAPVNTSNLIVDWPNNAWEGLVQNAGTAAKVAQLNADIISAGGCGELIEPTGGVLPSNATVILVTSFNMDTALNQFGAITETIYILFQDNPSTVSGHFANFGSGIRTLVMNFASCFDSASYDRSLLVSPTGTQTAADGATVNFTPDGIASYVNFGCTAPVPPFTVDAGVSPISVCPGASVTLNGSAIGFDSVQWSAPSGIFSDAGSLTTSYTLPVNATSPVTLTLTATNICGAQISDTVLINLAAATVPTFNLLSSYCTGAAVQSLPMTSTNGITGTWNPTTISNTTSGAYLFTPDAGQCASSFTLNVTITNSILPTFNLTTAYCTGATVQNLPTTSNNGITGTWNPSTISNMTSGNYIFTPDAGQCASAFTLSVTITGQTAPIFAIDNTVCSGATMPELPTTSNNGISGTWNPTTISNTTSGTYLFTPDAGQCASSYSHFVTVANSSMPTFTLATTYCSGSTVDTLPTTSDNGIPGIWTPSVIDNTASGTYLFTPTINSCASNFTLAVTITDSVTPDFDLAFTVCPDAEPTSLPTVSPNGISGTWIPAELQAAGAYVFTPDAGQCAEAVTLIATVSSADFTVSQSCDGTDAVLAVTANPGSEVFGATWYDADDMTVGTGSEFNVTDWLASNTTAEFPIVFSVAVVNQDGCVSVENVTVSAVWCGIPKGVSANGDNANDNFNLSGLGVSQLKIFSRYGLEVYSRNDYTNQWVGQSNDDNDLPEGTYYYVIATYSGETKTGWVYLIRKA